MQICCLKCKKDTENKNLNVLSTSNDRKIMSSYWTDCAHCTHCKNY